ncbi:MULTISPECIES: CusA/CzcA family heavy metal efflux RND transporter [Pseudoalteromonas]|uniref:efflux RND transporter permease subunit n=1 Tax=Pseudoalteromonas TaxID=53246 RepID=UPI0002C9148A|nr:MULTISPECIES: CusA/CzcA family heavy metal efflux RND transporter [Pseudoalteromonas]ENN98129.1 Heavy metal efflux pump CzcA [Pseudoalteromonas agarivorans S816]TMS64891.1 CusA/CzcA family heavy metal efflux RND transporter [Pseudoalteromonas sp. S1691]TMS67825.1 CusA/CzcA family heavy metal efflux RND transporter [Pseudoalteromonas sp. S1731]TMS70934.1 CusA/CzcA family heavy metal efflux RND transporter [Pseudoalteromonas sp. S1941]TMS76099.1 CusA/CzcA family heavy metal efflux RND transpo|tara:strand:- start:8288 stop:11434 length:3147 start_codon:yes stop_codon:yes gene_type:complete
MLDSILKFSIERSKLILIFVFAVGMLGVWNFQKLPIDAVPDITNVQVVINTEASGYTPLEVEQRVTFPLETALSGVPNLEYTRSVSRYGLSQVIAIFTDETDIYFARQLVNERLGAAKSELPFGLEPELGPISTGLGEIFMFTVDAREGATNKDGSEITPTDLRTVHDWVIRPQLMQVEGVVEVNPIGGYEREILIALNPDKLLMFGLSQQNLIEAINQHNQNKGAGFIEKSGAQWLIRLPGQIETVEQLANIPLPSSSGRVIRVKDVAEVTEGKELRSGAATQNGREVVLSTVFMLIGENSQKVAKGVGERLKEINKSLPEGIVVNAVYDRTKLVNKTLDTVKMNLIEGAILVIVVLFLLLGNFKAAFLTALVIPFAMLMTVTGMIQTRTSANLMSLGALDFGLLVDGAIIIVENCLRRLSQASNGNALPVKERLLLVYEATREVIRPALFGVFIITAVYLPIFALTGVEGKMFHPMAITVVIALVSAMILSVTFIPAAIALTFKGKVVEKENVIMKASVSLYKPILSLVLKARWVVVIGAVALVSVAGVMSTKLGSEFVPNLDEGDIAMHALRIPGTSLTQSIEMQKVLEDRIKSLPEVERVFAKVGTPDVATDAMPPSVADNFIILKPRSEWPDPDKPKADFVKELEALVTPIPGNRYEFLQPIQMRFNELLAGVRAELAIKVFGDDFDTLTELGKALEKSIQGVEGIRDIQVEQTKGLPVLTFDPKREQLALYGLSISDFQNQVAVAMGGEIAGKFYDGDKRFDIVVRLPEEQRQDVDALSQLPITLPSGGYLPLQELANIEMALGVNQVNRENGKRRVVVTANVRGRDLGSFVKDVQQAIDANVQLPAGYWIEYGGTYQKLQSASQRLSIVVPVTLVLIIGLLLLALGSLKDSLIIFTGVPLALTGGIFALIVRDIPFSISAAVGFIALSGIAILNGLVMVSFIRDLVKKNYDLETAIIKGALTRLRPVLTTALVASLGFIPMALNTGIGSEVQRPLATVVIGGVISSTILTLFVLPALYRLLHSKDESLAEQNDNQLLENKG